MCYQYCPRFSHTVAFVENALPVMSLTFQCVRVPAHHWTRHYSEMHSTSSCHYSVVSRHVRINAETIMRLSTIVKEDTASCDIVHGSSIVQLWRRTKQKQSRGVVKFRIMTRLLSLMLAALKDKASNSYTNKGTQLWAAEFIKLTICQCGMATLKASRRWNAIKQRKRR